ncbi:MAG: cbb3-type cytochrome oxidase assembly protein CcoS [Rubrivivax sp.]|nr:cbb3-type cytochrome oxidase assembly protein CcoS [Rubrivivax sp.]
MESMYLLVPLSAALVLLILGVFAWALHRGQFDDLESEGQRILVNHDEKTHLEHGLAASVRQESTRRSDSSKEEICP